jgi:glycosyltransferase involved in cell wall biosynthesis
MDNTKEDKKGSQFRVCVISYPFSHSQKTRVYCLLFNFLEIIQTISEQVFVITGNIRVDAIPQSAYCQFINFKMEIELKKNLPFFISLPIWILNYIFGQIRMSYHLTRISRSVDVIIFFLGYDYLLPLITAKILRKKTIIIVTMSSKSIKKAYNTFFYTLSRYIETATYSIVDFLILDIQNRSLLDEEKYKKKIKFGARHVNLDQFQITKKIQERETIVGYIGRFSEEKGIKNFLAAIPIILKDYQRIKFFIGGDGVLYDEVVEKIKTFPEDKIIFSKWISNTDLPSYLNDLKLIVIPSYTETGPFIALEAMACGTPVLGSAVGLLPDIIINGTTGFLLEDNSPETIAKNISRILKFENLDEIVDNARKIIKNEFTYKAAIETYAKILDDCLRG